ncbi:DUF4328 domain-containing protein [Dactylosporangium siamense]|uniref:DUF4328 domain-containing protein n=1 Tax=Dactylosporangium siamense TaxID=685454 RepID=A0A919U8G1_9ACTN|nr:DUF4328 domain-containing protein [Dactylosporangium siamense]GIG42745.1 hypothetical protein Dsi01nite_007860 [Dactylosporangium siamense]
MSDLRIGTPHRLATVGWLAVGGLALAGLAHAFTLAESLKGADAAAEDAGREVAYGSNFGLNVYVAGNPGLTALGVARLITLVLVILWLYLARDNFDRRNDGSVEWKKGWTIGGWFVPFANLVIPNRVTAEIYRRSAPDGSWPSDRLVNAWWVALLFSFISYTETTKYASGETIVYSPPFFTAVAAVGGIAAAILLSLVIRKVSAWQDAKLTS